MFPSIGCDLIDMSRIHDAQGIAKRILSKEELEIFEGFKGHRQLEFLAGRFAAREAIVKALPVEVSYRDIVIMPKTLIHYQGYAIQVSISHEKDMAMAVALAIKEDQTCEKDRS